MNESNIKGISIRAIIVFALIIIFSITVFTDIKSEALNSIVMTAMGWYFGQKTNSVDNNSTTSTPVVPTSDVNK